jgi:polyphosphate:AMP phosphotransferase
MFEAAELGRKVSKDEYKAREVTLREQLLDAQNALRAGPSCPAFIVFDGIDGAGKGETVNLLNSWMDPRWIVTTAFDDPSDEERERPEYWRYWRALAPNGRIGLFLSSWYTRPVLDRVHGRADRTRFEQRLNRIVEFEQMLADDGALILKFWMHLGRDAQQKRLKSLEKNPLTRWRVSKLDWKHWRLYDRFIGAAERSIRQTNRASAPWLIVDGEDPRHRSLTVAAAVRDAIQRHLQERSVVKSAPAAPPALTLDAGTTRAKAGRRSVSILSSLDMTRSVGRDKAGRELERHQGKLNVLQRKASNQGLSTILVFEGWDAAGKGGAVRRVTEALDARRYQVIPIAAPTDEERAHHYLWRFWRHLPRSGRVTIFDRSWYGRVLVERVERFATEKEWMRAYAEINQFELQLIEHGIVLLKFWLHVTNDEQLRRFKEREKTPYKSWKLTEEDWRNRTKWPQYEMAVNDMIEQTSTRDAPWTLVESNDKNYARLKIIKTICARLDKAVS